MSVRRKTLSRILVAALSLSLAGCASISIDRSDIPENSRLIVLSTIEDKMFINDTGMTIFERRDDAYIPLDNWGLAEEARQMVIRLLQSDPKFEIADNGNRGASQFSEHVQWESTNFGKLGENTRRVQAYCSEETADYLLLIQPGLATTPTMYLLANRGFGYDQRRMLGKRTVTSVGYSSIVLLYDCASGKEIEGLNEVVWHRLDVSESLEPGEIEILPEVEVMRAEHTERYMAAVKAAIERVRVFSLP